MQKKISSALISVFYKDGLEPVVKELQRLGITIYSTGGTQKFIEGLGIPCMPVESLTTYPSILGGRVKTLHPAVFGGILGRRDVPQDTAEMKEYKIPEIDLVVVDLYPFEETLAQAESSSFTGTAEEAEKMITEKIDIGGPSMIRAAAKNCKDLLVVAAKDDYAALVQLLSAQNGETSFEQRRAFAAKAFEIVMHYDIVISNYFNPATALPLNHSGQQQVLRYGENPHQQGVFYGNLSNVFDKLHGKELSYNNLVDVDAAVQLIGEFPSFNETGGKAVFAVIKHTNVCGIASRGTIKEAWDAALAGDPESAFGGVLVCNGKIDKSTAEAISEIFFEVLIADGYYADALGVLQSKKNRILLTLKQRPVAMRQSKTILNGVLLQENDKGNYSEWKEAGGRETTVEEKEDLAFANIVCKHLKSNAIALVKHKQLLGKGCGQTSRIDALRQAVEKAGQFKFDLNGAVLASDAFFPFNDCVKLGHEAGISAFIQPGGSIRDKDSIEYCVRHKLALVITGLRHFRH
ncbi:bifunctional phosphoribosylaminoimidazolecarboxamide formyltransferase/IMP cyclohydrolase [Agriterribacter sp.]|uniref:bifunctional phosphoribosylaminoimidazolecarboxamide formyltransferase/IMP cyclohydrolase n=1 Tax=Agriterribacter sp. TaxID=2821509 RepID=UPI002C38F3EC|nr:bifunctional phosphoribosylaminoimidazolecarboxamide formyltransferase/IMP cyclohydrolase [Agriterribacter sp.]HRP54651.1 bifunctional phosphoribosylaminoimidazolecarboxamide formyltransferase/IMP cyclohydrolase [Agriterribacter sp.]